MTVTATQDPPPVRTIARDELLSKISASSRDPNLKLVFCLNAWSFRRKRIPTSIHFETPELMLAALKKDDEIVVYCTNEACHQSLDAYKLLVAHGYTNVRRYAGGINDWEDGDLPLEGDWMHGDAHDET